MSSYDIFMLVVLGAATAWGAYKGLAWQVASLSAIFVSYFVALRFREPVSRLLPAQEPWNRFLAMLLVYIACSLVIWMVFRFVSEIIDRVKLKEFDRQIGALLGFAKGVLLCVIITLFAVTLTGDQRRQSIVNSRSGHYISKVLAGTSRWIPPEARQVVQPHLERWNQRLQEAGQGGPESSADEHAWERDLLLPRR
jgi:membrane protein required for colicin V production